MSGRYLAWAIISTWENMGSELGALELGYLSSVGSSIRPGVAGLRLWKEEGRGNVYLVEVSRELLILRW